MAVNSEKVKNEIYKMIQDDPTIRNAGHVGVSIENNGFWIFGKKEIHLRGRVETEYDKKKIKEIAETHSRGLSVMDNLRVES